MGTCSRPVSFPSTGRASRVVSGSKARAGRDQGACVPGRVGCSHTRPAPALGGGVGVEVFFVLSGFLITGLLLAEQERTGRINISGFYGRRAVRLLPALFLVLVVFTAYDLTLARSSAPSPQHMLATDAYVIAYIGNWVRAYGGQAALASFGHTWSLSIEEQFYLFWLSA